MEGRRLGLLASAIVCGLVGCHSDNRVPAPPPPPTASVPKDPNLTRLEDEPKEEPKTLNAKPSTCVRLGDFKAQLAMDTSNPNYTAEQREAFAQQAKQSYRRALELDAKFVPAFLGLAVLSEGIGERDASIGYYRTVLKLDPVNIAGYVGIARTYESAGMRDQAVATYNAAIIAVQKDAGAQATLWYERGMCLARARQFDEAVLSLQRAATLRPKNPDYNKKVGLMLARLDRPDEALQWLSKSMKEADAHYNLSRMLEHIGQHQGAHEHLILALKADPAHEPSLRVMQGIADRTPPEPQPQAQPVQPTVYRVDDAPPADVQQASTLPARPASPPAATVDRPAAPLIPVLSDSWEGKPPLTPSVSSAAPTKPEQKPRAKPALGFEEAQ